MTKINVLIFPAGEVNSIELHDALASCVNINVYGASSIDRHGSYVFKNYISGLPLISSNEFFEKFNEVLVEKKIDLVFPTHDTVATVLADNADRIRAKIISADKRTSAICRDKLKTYELFADCDFIPKIYSKIETFPVFIKPIEGQGAIGAKLINSSKDVPNVDLGEYVICEYLPGKEYTVDCLTDKNGNLRFISPRSRNRIMAGISVASEIEEVTTEIQNIAEKINNRLAFLGLWWFQIKQNQNGKWILLEISTRCAGTMALTRARGINLPLLSVYTAIGYEISVEPNFYHVKMDSSLIRRYTIDYDYDIVYFDFDDTITLRGNVNLKAIWFLYQCQNYGKKVILITKHEKEIYKTMNLYHIDKGLFNRIIHIKPEDKKSDFINPYKAIFIDNSYQERDEVRKIHNIPVFDVDGLDTLMDWRY
jgi:predicted ATP-grasp superfamily ATP-dependent carboligase